MTVSVVIPAYNAAKYLAEAIDSALNQTEPPYEIVVVDDGSKDNTAEVVRAYGSKIRYIYQENRGLPGARNRGIEESRGEWLAFLDADDLWDHDKLRCQRVALEKSGAALCYTGHAILEGRQIVRHNQVPDRKHIRRVLLERCVFMPSSVVAKKSAVQEVGGFDTELRRAPEDWDMWLRMMRKGHDFVGVPDPLLIYRVTPGSITQNIEAFMDGQVDFVWQRLTAGLNPLKRWYIGRRVQCRLEEEAAVLLREQGRQNYLHWALKSLATWPFPLSLRDRRFATALHMLLAPMLRRSG